MSPPPQRGRARERVLPAFQPDSSGVIFTLPPAPGSHLARVRSLPIRPGPLLRGEGDEWTCRLRGVTRLRQCLMDIEGMGRKGASQTATHRLCHSEPPRRIPFRLWHDEIVAGFFGCDLRMTGRASYPSSDSSQHPRCGDDVAAMTLAMARSSTTSSSDVRCFAKCSDTPRRCTGMAD